MRQDAKIGLALGMLVLGLAGAFCFPRLPASGPWLKLEVPVPIADSELEFLPIRAYPPAPAVAATELVEESAAEPQQKMLPVAGAPPAPIIPLVCLPATPATDAASSDSAGTSPENRSPAPFAPAGSGRQPAARPSEERTYTVQSRDTLSQIAQKLLGSSQRYLEIYEANLDQLASPDSLKVGMTLRIPPRNHSSQAVRTAGNSGPEADPQ